MNEFHPVELDERAFAIFLMDGIHFYLEQDPQLRRASVIDYCFRLWGRWQQMDDHEKRPFVERAMNELRRLRRYLRADIYRVAMQDEIPEPDLGSRRRSRHLN